MTNKIDLQDLKKKEERDELAFLKWNLWKEERMELFRLSLLTKEHEDAGCRVHLCYDCFTSTTKVDLNGVRRLQIPNEKSPKLDEPWCYTLLGVLFSSAPFASNIISEAFGPETIPESKLVYQALNATLSLHSRDSSHLFASMSKDVEQDAIHYSEKLSGLSSRNREEWYKAMFNITSKENFSVTRQFLSLHQRLEHVFKQPEEERIPVLTEEEANNVFLFVPGLYSGYFPGGEDAPDQFRRNLGKIKEIYGLETRYLDELEVDGSCSVNAKTIFEAVKKIYEEEGKQVVLLGYSKGCADVSTFLCLYGEKCKHMLRGFTSMMGAFGGSAIASALYGDRTRATKSVVESVIAKRSCRIDALKDITLERRDALLREAPFPVGLIPMVSIVASIKDCSFDEMYGTYKFIHIAHKMESDGLICIADQTVPGSCVVNIKGMNHAGAGEQNIVFRHAIPFIASMFISVLRFNREKPDEKYKMYIQPIRLISTERSHDQAGWDQLLSDPIFASDAVPSIQQPEIRESFRLEEKLSSPNIEKNANAAGSPQQPQEDTNKNKKLQFENLNKTKLIVSVVYDRKIFQTKSGKLTKVTIDINGSQENIASIIWPERTCFTIWKDQLNTTSKDLLFVLEQQHTLKRNDILIYQRPLLKSLQIEEGKDTIRAVMLNDKLLLLVNILCIPKKEAPPPQSHFASNAGLRLPTPLDPHSSIGKQTAMVTGVLLVGAATIVFPPLGLGMAVAGLGMAGATAATSSSGKKEKQQEDLKKHYKEFQDRDEEQ